MSRDLNLFQSKLDVIEQSWLNHVADGFPRDLRFVNMEDMDTYPPKKFIVSNEENFLHLMWKYYGKYNQWVSLFPLSNISKKSVKVNKLYYDFDIPKKSTVSLDMAYEQVKRLHKYFAHMYDTNGRVYFSGKKGFHLLIDTDPISIENYEEVMKAVALSFIDQLKLTLLDLQPVTDKMRVTRLPYTKHLGSNNLCIPVDLNRTIDQILEESKLCKFNTIASKPTPAKSDGIQVWLKSLDSTFTEKRMKNRVVIDQFVYTSTHSEKETSSDKKKRYGEELTKIYGLASTWKDGRHRAIAFVIVPRLLYLGESNEFIIEWVRTWIERTPESRDPTSKYVYFAKQMIKRTQQTKMKSWRFDTFLAWYPELIGNFAIGIEK